MNRKQTIYTNAPIIELLHKLPPFSMFSLEEIRSMLYSGKLVRIDRFEPGQVILEEGGQDKWVYLLMKGRVRVTKDGLTLCTLDGRGDVVGEMGAIGGKARSATVTAVDDAVCLALNIEVIEHMGSGERDTHLQRIRTFFKPIIEERERMTREVTDILRQIRSKEEDLAVLRSRLRELNVTEERSMLAMLMGGD